MILLSMLQRTEYMLTSENSSAPNANIDKVKKMCFIAEITVMENNPRAKPWLELRKTES